MTTTLTLLGTAAGPTPKVGRQAPAQAIVVDGSAYLIDCGNGVAAQLVRAGIALSSLRAIFLTHHHSDHNADFGTLFLVGWSQIRRPIRLLGPPPLGRMVEQFVELHSYDIGIRTAGEGRPPLRPLIQEGEIESGGVVYEDDLVKVTAALVHHPPVSPAFGYRFDSSDRSIVISGDTTVCDAVVELSRGADVLVHEAMHTTGLEAHVAGYNASRLLEHLLESHTRVEDAGAVAQRASVKTLVLSHLFPADASAPDSTWEAGARAQFTGDVIVGRDLRVI